MFSLLRYVEWRDDGLRRCFKKFWGEWGFLWRISLYDKKVGERVEKDEKLS